MTSDFAESAEVVIAGPAFSVDINLVIKLDTRMGFPTKVQLIKRSASEQWYINFPSAVAQAMDFAKGETVEWVVSDKRHLILVRKEAPADPVNVEKKTKADSSKSSAKS